MLFDLRGSGRRTTVKAVYLTLALLMGGGLVLFGIGGDVSGGLVDALNSDSGSLQSGDDRFRDRAAEAQRAAEANPQDPAAFAALARARYQYASAGDFIDRANGTYTAEGKAQLQAAATAWEKHLQLAGDKPDDSVANVMVQVYSQVGLNDPEKAVRAQEIITEARPKDSTFATLAVLAYQAGQTRKGDLATNEALALSDKADRNTLKSELETAKQQAISSQIQDATGATGAATPAPTTEGNTGSGGTGNGKKNNQNNKSGD
jgi:hypothetical protein